MKLFRSKPQKNVGLSLYAACVEQARLPDLYLNMAVPDTVEGRFELYTLHVMLLLDRMRGQGARAQDISQALFDSYIQALDDALREMGVGDLSVGKKMRKLGEAFYGRAKSYEVAFASLPDTQELNALLARTVFAETPTAEVAPIASYVLAQRDNLLGLPLEAILDGNMTWGAA